MSRKPVHAGKEEIFCNRCEKYVNKWTQTMLLDEQVVCLMCHNWLAGEFDVWGDLENISPTIKHINELSKEFNG